MKTKKQKNKYYKTDCIKCKMRTVHVLFENHLICLFCKNKKKFEAVLIETDDFMECECCNKTVSLLPGVVKSLRSRNIPVLCCNCSLYMKNLKKQLCETRRTLANLRKKIYGQTSGAERLRK